MCKQLFDGFSNNSNVESDESEGDKHKAVERGP